MTTHWISRAALACATMFRSPVRSYGQFDDATTRDADSRRLSAELHAIRARFQDHS